MNVRDLSSFLPLVLLSALTGCIQEADTIVDDTGEQPVDTDTSPPPVDSGAGDDTATESDDAYTYDVSDRALEIDRTYNPYPGEKIGFFCDNCGTEDGWTRAVTLPLQSSEGDLTVNLGAFGNGTDLRWSLAVVNDDLEPTQWLWESGTVSGQLQEHDSLGLTIPVKECVGDELVTKLDFCTQISSAGIAPGSCWGTYVEPTDCSDADNDGDVDPDTDGNVDDGNTDTGDDGSDSGDSGSGSGSGSAGSCDIRITADGDSSIEGDSTYSAEVYILPLDASGGVIDSTYWPSGDWSSQAASSLTEALSFSDGGTDSDTFTFDGDVEQVKINGGVWNGSSFLRWLVGSYSDTVGASFTVEKSCDGESYSTLSCGMSGNDYLCR